MNDSKDFQDAESVRSGNSHVTSQPMSFPKHPILEGLLRPSFVSPRRKEGPPSIWDTHGISGFFFFANTPASSSAPFLQLNPCMEYNNWGAASHVYSGEKWKTRKIEIWDASLDRQPKIQSSSVEETLQRILRQTNNDCRIRIFSVTSSVHQQHLRAGRWGSRPRYVLVHNSLRRRCHGSRKWSWLIQWMNLSLRHQSEEFECLILKYLMRGSLQHWTKSSIIPTSKEESVWRNKRPRSRTVSFVGDRLPTWSMNTSGSLGAMILSRTLPTCSLSVFEVTIFRNSTQSGTEYYCQWRKSRMMTSWKDCTN